MTDERDERETSERDRAWDPTVPHNFVECRAVGSVGSTCPDYLHCVCGKRYDAEVHRHVQDAGGLL